MSSESTTILIVGEHPVDRNRMTAVLRTQYKIVEASDGPEALNMLAQITPDVVITDILMPTVDGYEFVRRMREIPGLRSTPVIFHTPVYHEREARALATQGGIVEVLTKPSAPQVILATVDAALGSSRLVGAAGDATINRLDVDNERMKATLEAAEQIAAQRDRIALINNVCSGGRRVTLAQHAVVGLVTEEGSPTETLYSSGLDAATAVSLKPPSPGSGLLAAVVGKRQTVRTRNPSILSVPIASSSRVYGWLSLHNKLGADEFTELDERVAIALGTHAGIAYENAHLVDDLHRRINAFEREIDRISARVREEERAQLSRNLHDQMGQVLVGLKIDLHRLGTELTAVARSPNDISGMVESILHRIDEASETVRRTARGLRPAVLDKLGLVAAIEWQAEEFERRSGIRCRVDSQIDDVDLDPSQDATVFRIVQEALTNVLQHAHATRATVTLRRSSNSLSVSVADTGIGISDLDLASDASLGLIGMRERASLLDGRLEVRRQRPAGTVITLTVPLTKTREPRS